MTEIKDSALPPAPLKGGPVLCLDIDGVSSPLGQDNRYDLHAPTPGLVPVAGAGHTMQVHPALPDWIAELEQAFAQCVWVSTWRESCRHFAECAGLGSAADWPYLMPVDAPPVPGPPFSSYKLEAVRAWVTPETPVAIVDDHLVDQDYSSHEYREMGESKVLFVQRPGPTLLIGPDRQIGLTRPIVDLLCRFAEDPADPAFGLRCALSPDSYWWVQWPWPLPAGQEQPVLIRPDDEEAWRSQREELRKESEQKENERFRNQWRDRQ